MAQYILSDVFTAIAETSGTIVNVSNVPVEISDSTKNRTGIILFPRQHFPFSKAVYAARAPGAIGTAFIGVISTGCCCNGSGSPADSESDSGFDSEDVKDVFSDTDTDTETETDIQTDTETETDTQTDTQTESESQTDTETDTQTETESDSGDEFDSEDIKEIFDSESESETDDFYDDDHFDPEDNEFSKFDLDEIFDDSDFELSGFTEEDIKDIFKD